MDAAESSPHMQQLFLQGNQVAEKKEERGTFLDSSYVHYFTISTNK